jgi:cobalt-zinc-cadmium efflux system membrane fusion protein
MKKYIILFAVFATTFCGGGEKDASLHSQQHDQQEVAGIHSDHEQTSQELHIPPEKQKAWGIVTAPVSFENIPSTVTLPGVIALNQNRTAHISSFVPGKVISLSADSGYNVRKGQVLVTINSPEFAQAQADFLRARTQYLLSVKEYERAKLLFKEKAIEEKEYLRREAEHEKLTTEYGALGSALHSYGLDHEQIDKLIEKCKAVEEQEYKCEIANPELPIRSPLPGKVIFRDVVIGEHVEPDKVLFTVSDLASPWAFLDAHEKDLPSITEGYTVKIASSLYPERAFPGKITNISSTIDEKLRTIKVRVEIKNSSGFLKPNMYIQGRIEKGSGEQRFMAVPENAVQNLNGSKIVFVMEKDDIFFVRPVQLGRRAGDKRIISQGLNKGDRVVIEGAFQLKAELTKGTFGEAHAH